MLQRRYLAPKWHPDWSSSRRLKSGYRPTLLPTRSLSTAVAVAQTLSSSSNKGSHGKPNRLPGNADVPNPKSRHSMRKFARIAKDLVIGNSPAKLLETIKNSPALLLRFSDTSALGALVNAFAKSTTPEYSARILKLAHDLGYTLGHPVYESACRHLWESRQWDCLLAVTLYAKRHVGCTSVKLLNWRATALMETGQYALLQNILEEFQIAGLSPNQSTYHLIMTGCIRNHDLEGSKRCLQDMKNGGFNANATTQIILSKSYWQFGADIAVRQNAIGSLPELQPRERMIVINNLLQFSLAQHDLKTVRHLLSMFDSKSSYLLASFVSSCPADDGFTQIAEHKVCNTEPNADTYAIFMNHQNKVGNPETAIHLWQTASAAGLSATPNVIAALIHSYFLRDHGDTAIRMIAGISCQSGVKEFQSLLIDPSDQEEFPQLHLPHSALTIRICNVLMASILKRQGLAFVPAIFSIMHSNHLKPNDRTLEVLLSHLNHTQEPRPRTLLQIARKLAPSNRPSSRHLHSVISCILRDEKRFFIGSAWKMRSKAPQPVKERHTCVRLLEHGEHFDPMAGLRLTDHLSYDRMARSIMHSLSIRRVKVDPAVAFLRMRQDAMLHLDTESALAVLRSMLARGLRPTARHFFALVEGYALSGNFASANRVIEAAKEANIQPDIAMYTTLIAAHAKHRDPTSAKRVFDEMVSTGIRPDIPAVDALISAFYAANKLGIARRLLVEIWPSIQPFPEALQTASLATLLSHFRALHPYRSRGVPFKKSQRAAIYTQIKQIYTAYNRCFSRSSDITIQDKEDSILGK